MNEEIKAELDLIKVGASAWFVSEPDVDILKHTWEGIQELVITGRMFGQSSLKEYSFSKPLDWWEAVKERFAPNWFIKKYPVKYEVHHIDVDLVYPELSQRIKLPKEAHKLIIRNWYEEK